MAPLYFERVMASKKKSSHASPVGEVVPNLAALKKQVDALRKEGKKIVLTQGVWDLIHEGHAKYLQLAKQQGDVLIVGVDSDKLTRERKGPKRPIVPEGERLTMLSHLRHVDYLFLRQPSHGMGKNDKVVQTVAPDILVLSKSTGKLNVKNFKGAAKKIVYLEPQSSTSTTARIRMLSIDAAEELSQKVTELLDDFLKNKL